ncbi:MAG: toll/interleukin-1 receptor domain-containing protein [Geminicoccaceae bacterium]
MPKAFISYSHVDQEIAKRVALTLKDVGLEVWFDVDQLNAGQSFIGEINTNLTNADYLILLVSEHSLKSRFVDREWMSFLANKGAPIIPLLINGNLPPILSDVIYIDFRNRIEQGLEELRRYFKRENTPVSFLPKVSNDLKDRLSRCTDRQLRLIAQGCMLDDDLKDLIFDFNIDDGSLNATSRHGRITEILDRFRRISNDKLRQFADWLADQERIRECVDAKCQ